MSVLFLGQLLVRPVLDDRAFVENHDAVALLDCSHSVRYNNAGSPFHSSIQGLLNDFLALLVKCTCRLVQDDNLRGFYQCARNRDSLLLTARQLAAFETANFLKTCIKLVFGSFYSLLVYKSAESLTVEALDSRPVALKEHAKQLLSASHCPPSFQTFAEVYNCLEVEFTLILVETSYNFLSALIGYLL